MTISELQAEDDNPATAGRNRPLADIPPLPATGVTTLPAFRRRPSPKENLVADPAGDALSLIDRAARTIVHLAGRVEQLETQNRELAAWAKDKLQELQHDAEDAGRRADDAEQTLRRERTKLSAIADRIEAALGADSDVHRVIEAAEDAAEIARPR